MPNFILTVTELNETVRAMLQNEPLLSGIRLRGEVSNFKRHTSGHLYFSLKDEGGLIRCVMFRTAAQRLKFMPRDGMKVVLAGQVSLYVKDGQYQFYAEQIEQDGQGALYIEFEKRKARLLAEGLFDQSRKKPLPAYPAKIAVITSPTGAAVQDILRVATRRNPNVALMVIPVAVQGAPAAGEIAAAIQTADAREDIDVIIVGRGGGSIEELWAFNEEVVAYAIAACKTPIISAVGHETDTTLADFVADIRAATPSMAAEIAVPERRAMVEGVSALSFRLGRALNMRLERERRRYDVLIKSRVFRHPLERLLPLYQSVDMASSQLGHAMKARISKERLRLLGVQGSLQKHNPLGALERGFAYVERDGHAVKNASVLSPGDAVTLRFRAGQAQARIEQVERSGIAE